MADNHLQVNPDGTTEKRKTVLWPSKKNDQEQVIRKIFERNNWKVSEIKLQSGCFWKIVTRGNVETLKINLYISSIRDESRQDDEFKMQLGSTFPNEEEDGWVTLVLGIYVINDGVKEEYILSGYNWKRYDFSGNPSLRGTRTAGLQKAKTYGMFISELSILFMPEFIYYYIYNYKHIFGDKDSYSVPSSLPESSNLQIYSFLTAIRTKPFLLLAGISGTGKSRIVRKLAQASVTETLQKQYDPKSVEKGFNRWELQKPANFELIQVKPNWHNSLEVVGYKSNIGGEHYEYTPFVEFIARAWKHSETPFFLCLDEMNLAPVEQYFAEFLSAIENRTYENDEYETDPIIKPFTEFGDKVCSQMLDHLVGKVEASKVIPDSKEAKLIMRFKTKGLTLPENLIVLGTVNMDDTTFSFSRKVLDRAMSIVMNDVNYDKFFDGKTENDIPELTQDVKDLLIQRPIRGLGAESNDAETVKEYLIKINSILDKTPFKLGYRAANEALLYVSASHLLNPHAQTTDALDEFTMMKILSRIEGDKRSISDVLNNLKSVIDENYPKSSEKLKNMEDSLNKGMQFVSYWI